MNKVSTYCVRLSVLLALFLMPFLMSAQPPMIGIELGYGRSQMTAHGHSFISPIDPDFATRKSIGIRYGMPVSSWFSISSGLEFISRKETIDHFDNLAIPFYTDFTIGNSFQFIIGPGLHLNYLVDYDIKNYKYLKGFEENNNVFQLSWQLHAGVAFRVKSKTRIHILFEQGFDLTPITNYAHTDTYYILNDRWYDGMITAGVMINIFDKKY